MTPLGAALLEAVAYHLGSSGGIYQELIQKRFGLTTSQPATLEALALDVGCTRERIRQIETQFVAHSEALAATGVTRFPDITPLRVALRHSNGTWAEGTRRVEELLGFPVFLPGLYRLVNCFGGRLPPVGFGSIVLAHGYTLDEVKSRLEMTLGKRIPTKDIAAWTAAPHRRNFEDAPVWAIEALKKSEEKPLKALPPDLEDLPQRELIRKLMLRSGFTRKQMMEYLEVNRSTFDRWLWPAERPTPIPSVAMLKFIELAGQVGTTERPRTRHLGPPKKYDFEGIPGCARRSRSRETGAMITLYKTNQATLPPGITKAWATVCEDHQVVAEFSNFATGLRAMAQTFAWCPDCEVEYNKLMGLAPKKA